MKYKIAINNQKFEIEIGKIDGDIAQVNVNGEGFEVWIENYDEIISGPSDLKSSPPVRTSPPAVPATKAPLSSKAEAPARAAQAPPVRAAEPTAPAAAPAPKKAPGKGEIIAPIPGRIMEVKVKIGDAVQSGQTVATMEAMKMENNITSTIDGTVQEIRVQKDSEVATGQVIMIIG